MLMDQKLHSPSPLNQPGASDIPSGTLIKIAPADNAVSTARLAKRVKRWCKDRFWLGLFCGYWEFARRLFAGSPRFGPPNETFSMYQTLRSGHPKINGRIVLHDQGMPRVDKQSLLVESRLGQHLTQPWPIFWSEHSNAQLVGPSLALLEDKKLCVESVYGEGYWRDDPAGHFMRLAPVTELKGNWTSLLSRWNPIDDQRAPLYGHWLHDALPRLALLPEFPPDTGILIPPVLGPAQKESLKIMGLWDRCRPTREQHLRIENYFFSSPTSMIDCYNPYSVRFIRETFLPKRDADYQGPRKFFLERTSKHRPLGNNAEVCDFFRQKGWTVIRDMDLSLAQTIKLFSEADAMCSMVGSNMSNVMFCKPGCTVMHLVPDLWLDGWIDWIAQTVDLDYHSALLPCRVASQRQIIVKPEWIEQFFRQAGVSF
jgi:hypothetical protein